MSRTTNIDEHLLEQARLLSIRARRSLSGIIEKGLRMYLKRSKRAGAGSEVELAASGEGYADSTAPYDQQPPDPALPGFPLPPQSFHHLLWQGEVLRAAAA